jgi:serine/threonine-protein kinase
MLPAPPPGYRLLAPLASGGMAEVFLGLRLGAGGLTKPVALKRIAPDLAADPDFVRMFLQEARIAVELSHGNVTSVFELAEADGAHYLVMEYVRGWDLARVLGACARRRAPLPPPLALFVATELTKALGYVHERRDAARRPLGLVHRDVSPANVLLSVDGAVLLADFGIARAAAAVSSTSPSWLKGKIPYMSPEQARAAPVDARSDLFSLGVVLFEMLTARRLFPGVEEAALLAVVRAAKATPPSSMRADIPADVDRLVLRAVAADPADRFQSAHEMQLELSRALRHMDPPAGSEELRAFLSSLGLPAPPDPVALSASASVPAPAPASVPASVPAPAPASASARAHARLRRPLALLACAVIAFGATALARRAWGPAERAGRLEVRSPTPGATVRIDGQPRGQVPLVIEGLPRRRVEVTIDKEGFTPFVRSVDLEAAPDQVLDAPLEPTEGSRFR